MRLLLGGLFESFWSRNTQTVHGSRFRGVHQVIFLDALFELHVLGTPPQCQTSQGWGEGGGRQDLGHRCWSFPYAGEVNSEVLQRLFSQYREVNSEVLRRLFSPHYREVRWTVRCYRDFSVLIIGR